MKTEFKNHFTKTMTKPADIIRIINEQCVCFKRTEIIALQRYWIAYFYPYYSHEAIANMTGNCDRSHVSATIKRLSSEKYAHVHVNIMKALIVRGGKPEYSWITK